MPDRLTVFHDLVRLETELWSSIDRTLNDRHQVGLAWVEVLGVIARTTDCRVIDIAQALSITVGGASKVVDRIAAAELCRRDPHPADARSNLLTVTSQGHQVLRTTRRTIDDQLAQLLGPALTADQLTEFGFTLQRLRRQLGAGNQTASQLGGQR